MFAYTPLPGIHKIQSLGTSGASYENKKGRGELRGQDH